MQSMATQMKHLSSPTSSIINLGLEYSLHHVRALTIFLVIDGFQSSKGELDHKLQMYALIIHFNLFNPFFFALFSFICI